MANRTVKDARSVKGTNPQYLVEKIIRTRIYECRFWKEECFALTAELMVDKAMELKYIGGIYGGNVKPTPFLCLVLKMLQIQPEKDIIVEFIKNEDFKYVRALGATYMRLVGTSIDCYKYLEPLYYDYRKLKRQSKAGTFELIHMDEFIEELLKEERVCDIILPRIQKRLALEETNQIELRVSALEEDIEEMETSDEEDAVDPKRSPSPDYRRGNYKDLDKAPSSPRHRRSPSPYRRERKKRSRSRERRHRSPGEKRKRDENERRHHRGHRSKREHRERHREEGRHHDRRDRHGRRSRHSKGDSGMSKEELEIQEANEMRARLGIPPLRS